MTIIAKIEVERSEREGIEQPGTLREIGDFPVDVEVTNLSETGCLLATDATLRPGLMFTLGIPGIGIHTARAVRHGEDGIGCEFLRPISRDEIEIAKSAEIVVEARFPQLRRHIREQASQPVQSASNGPLLGLWRTIARRLSTKRN